MTANRTTRPRSPSLPEKQAAPTQQVNRRLQSTHRATAEKTAACNPRTKGQAEQNAQTKRRKPSSAKKTGDKRKTT